MHVEKRPATENFLGLGVEVPNPRGGKWIVLSKRECGVLMAASRLADAIRTRARDLAGEEFDQTDDDLWLAEIEHNCRDIAERKELRILDGEGYLGS